LKEAGTSDIGHVQRYAVNDQASVTSISLREIVTSNTIKLSETAEKENGYPAARQG
jgi:hypothetical protein